MLNPNHPLKLGDTGEEVRALQTCLFDLGLLEEDAIHGKFGGRTATAIRNFQ